MAQILYEAEVPHKYKSYHFVIRSPRSNSDTIQTHIDSIMTMESNPLFPSRVLTATAKSDAGVLYVKLKMVPRQKATFEDAMNHFCHIFNKRADSIGNMLSARGPLGISPIDMSARRPFRNAIAHWTAKDGFKHLDKIDQVSKGSAPAWRVWGPLAVVIGVNIWPNQLKPFANKSGSTSKPGSKGSNPMKLYCWGEVISQATRLTDLMQPQKQPPRPAAELEAQCEQELQRVQTLVESLIEQMKKMSHDKDSRRRLRTDRDFFETQCQRTVDVCYNVLEGFAKCMNMQRDVMVAFIDERKRLAIQMADHGAAAVHNIIQAVAMLTTTTATQATSLAQVATTAGKVQYFASCVGVGQAPAVALFSPFTFGLAGFVTLTAVYQLYQVYDSAQAKNALEKKVRRLKKAAIIVATAWSVRDDSVLFLQMAVNHSHWSREEKVSLLEEVGGETLRSKWEALDNEVKAENKSTRAKPPRSQKQKGGNSSQRLPWSKPGTVKTPEKDRKEQLESVELVRRVQGYIRSQVRELEDLFKEDKPLSDSE